MKKTKLDKILIICVFAVLVFQVIYLTLYSFLSSDGENAAISLYTAILAMEFLALFAYTLIVLRWLVKLVPPAILSLKDLGEPAPVQSAAFAEIDEAIKEVKMFKTREKNRNKKMLELFGLCINKPQPSELFKEGLPLIMDISGAEACAYYYVNYGSSKLELIDSCGFDRELYKAMDTDIGEGLEGACCKSGRICFFADDGKENKYTTISSVAKKSFKNIMAVPVRDGENCAGVLTLAYINIIESENIAAAEQISELLSAAHRSSIRHEEFLRLSNEINLQNRLIREVSEEIKEKDAEIESLKAQLKKKD